MNTPAVKQELLPLNNTKHSNEYPLSKTRVFTPDSTKLVLADDLKIDF